MGGDTSNRSRRWVLGLASAAAMAGVAGCLDTESGGDGGEANGDNDDLYACIDDLEEDLPEAYATAESIDGIARDPNDLEPKDSAGYQCAPSRYQLCANCRFFILAQDEHDLRACTEIEGEVASQHWCGYYQPVERIEDDPNPLPHE